MQTANGPSIVSHCIKLYVEALDTNCTFLLKRGAPTLLSVGCIVQRKNDPFEFHWDQKVNTKGEVAPYIVMPNGSDIDLEVQNNTPSLFSRILPTTELTSNAVRSSCRFKVAFLLAELTLFDSVLSSILVRPACIVIF